MVGNRPALLEGACPVATSSVAFPKKRSIPPPLRLEGAAENAVGSATADPFPGDPPEVGLCCEVGVTCGVGAATSPFPDEGQASEDAPC